MFTGNATAWCVKKLMPGHSIVVKEVLQREKVEALEFDYLKTTIFADGMKLIGIADGCNGLSLFILFIGFLIAYPASLWLKIRYGFLGLILIVLVNILRCTGLAMFAYFNPKVLFFAHHYLFKVMVYGIVFFLWVRFTQINQKINQHA
jgi:exosortase/archaeosortase family protein